MGTTIRVCMLVFFCLGSLAHAASFPDSGSMYRHYKDDKMRTSPPEKVAPETRVEEKEAIEFDDTHKLFVTGFRVIGNEQFSKDSIHQLLDPYIHGYMSTRQIHEAANVLMRYYRERGFFAAKVYVPPHSIHDGVITLHVYEGFLEENGVELVNSEERVKSDILNKLITTSVKPGIIKQDAYERAILLVNDLPGISSQSVLFPGRQVGGANFLMKIKDEDRYNGNIDYDNFGDYYTGEHRFGTTLYLHSPTRHGEEIAFRYVTTGKDSNFGYLDVSLPVASYETRVGLSTDFLQYNLKHEFEANDARGNAWNGRAYVTYPFIRTRHFNVIGEASYNYTRLTDKDNSGELADRELHVGVLRVSGDHDDDFLANGVTYFNAYLTAGNLDLDGNDSYKLYDETTADTAGGFAKINAELSRLQHLWADLFTYVSLSGQLTHKNLDSSQKMFLGGPYGVGGYPVGEASGDNGALFYADLRYDLYDLPWKGHFQVGTFYTCGWLQIFHDPWDGWQGDNDIIENDVTLQSIGITASQTWSDRMVIRLMLGKQIGDHVTRNPDTGEAHDASDSDYRFWVNTIFYF